ncbi:MAG TPA: dihydrolipoyl dehydrogenase [Haliangiales bacterium]|nr:dihydrolipoyl dehydrogenase [Haliangiales bacterium]
MADYDLIVIGGGPGGYVAAIRAGQLGLKTLCVERENYGGICTHWGCIPTKALLRSAEVLELCRNAADFGVKIDGTVSFDFAAIIARARKIPTIQERGILGLFKKNKVDALRGTAKLLSGGRVAVAKNEGGEVTLTTKNVILATGARAKSLPSVALDGKRIIEYRGALTLPSLPKSMIVVGAGAIGVEFASFYHALGVDITLVEFLPTIVPLEDDEISQHLERSFKKRRIRVMVGTQVTGAAADGGGVRVQVVNRADPTKKEELRAEIALMAVGIAANVEGIGLEAAGVRVERGFVAIDERTYQTTAKGVYAIGDMTGPPALAHTASEEGIVCVERIAGMSPPSIDYDAVPSCTFCHPEIGSIGLTERAAKEQGVPVKVGHFPFIALGKARAAGDIDGFVKVLYHAEDGRLVGAHIIGPNAADLIAEYGLAKTTEVNAESLIHTIHAHPTLAEALKEATEDAYGHAIHI